MSLFETYWREKQKQIENRLQELVPDEEVEPKKLHQSVCYSLFADAKQSGRYLLWRWLPFSK